MTQAARHADPTAQRAIVAMERADDRRRSDARAKKHAEPRRWDVVVTCSACGVLSFSEAAVVKGEVVLEPSLRGVVAAPSGLSHERCGGVVKIVGPEELRRAVVAQRRLKRVLLDAKGRGPAAGAARAHPSIKAEQG